jgi:LEA14-like dessication related protein
MHKQKRQYRLPLYFFRMKGVKIPLLFFAMAFLCSSCARPLSPKYLGHQNLRLARVGLKNNILTTEIKLYNPNRYPLQLKSASMDVYFNNSYLGHSSLDTLINLPAKDTAYVPLQLQANAKDVLGNALRVFLNPDVKIRITGSVKAGRGGFFLNVPIDYEGVQRINLSDIR